MIKTKKDARSHLGPLVKHVVDVAKACASSKLSKDLPEQLLWVNARPTGPVVLLLTCATVGVESRCPVHVVLLPLHLIAQHLDTNTDISTP